MSAHPECSETTMEYDYEDGHTWASYWPEVLAVFAVQNNLNNDGNVVVIDEGKKRLIQDTFLAMHEIYVGSTGDSTGNHLHFEAMQNGVRMNPLELVVAQ